VTPQGCSATMPRSTSTPHVSIDFTSLDKRSTLQQGLSTRRTSRARTAARWGDPGASVHAGMAVKSSAGSRGRVCRQRGFLTYATDCRPLKRGLLGPGSVVSSTRSAEQNVARLRPIDCPGRFTPRPAVSRRCVGSSPRFHALPSGLRLSMRPRSGNFSGPCAGPRSCGCSPRCCHPNPPRFRLGHSWRPSGALSSWTRLRMAIEESDLPSRSICWTGTS